ncbi:MAG TPA: DUF4445 domain-containing protein [Candidatus Ornithomonoglobus intestinigallinarum]|uniref:DUF4445 domain-containing protein n=1 Tax=Candidatus Ornithomonoglobus intestinigallinarum TaxID=2840894 RepID=A0A9D1H3G8_9FIRM|nr:DUF4445 domain-containing protein [Candidatus Ornithomonoglobus intestinigallinarum]
MVLKDLDIKITPENVLLNAGCTTKSRSYEFILDEYKKIERDIADAAEPRAWVSLDEDEMRIYVIITAGEKISGLSSALFGENRAAAGLLASTAGDEYVFETDRAAAEIIKKECAKRGFGVKRRLEAPEDMPLQRQREIIDRTGADVSLTEGMQFIPEKTVGYILELTSDKSVFRAQHDCSKCSVKDCPRRVRGDAGSFSILSAADLETTYGGCVLCVDIGTTTIAAALLDGGIMLQSFSALNPQRRFGADVLSRIEAAGRGHLKELHKLIVFTISDFAARSKRPPQKIIVAANTAMAHMLLGLDCSGLGQYPFKPAVTDTVTTTLSALGGGADIPLTVIGGISTFVGGDITAGLAACGLAGGTKLSLFIDLGTNAEIALGNSEKLLVTSAAAGPAFEGGGISCGCGSVSGAVCGFDIKSGAVRTINGAPPRGICGSGITELVSELLDGGIIDKTGLFNKKYFETGFPVTENITFTQKDMRAFQTAKAAVRAGAETLMREYGITADDISSVYIAGGFGSGLDIKKAENAGLIPKGLSEKASAAGNTALKGAALLSGDGAESFAKRIKAISTDILLGENEYFSKRYIENMDFL